MKKHLLLALVTVFAFVCAETIANGSCWNTNCCSAGNSCYKTSNACCDNCCCSEQFNDCDNCQCGSTSHTTFVIRPQYQSSMPEKVSLFHDRMNIVEDGNGGTMQFTIFGGRSTRGDKLATYFTPFCKRTLLVREEDNEEVADIIAQHFNIFTKNGTNPDAENDAFISRISFCPRVSVLGIGFTFRQNLTQWLKGDENKDYAFWFELSTPLTRVATQMCLQEKIESDGDGKYEFEENINTSEVEVFASMIPALSQKAWKYGKIDQCKRSKWGLADIELKLGFEKTKIEHSYGGYIGVLLPTGNKPTGCYVFEPVVGHHKHFGITAGKFLSLDIWKHEEEEKFWKFVTHCHAQYLFSTQEMRSYDLKGKPWSRYMKVYTSKTQAEEVAALENAVLKTASGTPGINVFTQCLNVTPRLSCNANCALEYFSPCWYGELGYNFYVRQAECVKLCQYKKEIALEAAVGSGAVNRNRTINRNNDDCSSGEFDIDEYNAAIIKKSDIDLDSAAHPGFISHTVYGTLGYRWDEKDHPPFIGLGASYEFGSANYVLNRWTLFGKFGFSF